MEKATRKNMRFRRTLLRTLPKEITAFIVFLKGTGVKKHPVEITPQNSDSLQCTITYNKYGSFCTPNSCKIDEPVQATYRGEQYEQQTIDYIASLNLSGDIIHAGAYFGDTIPALSASISPEATIWAFEPNNESYRCAQITILINNIQNVKLHNHAIGSKSEKQHLLLRDTTSERVLGGTSRVVTESSAETQDIEVKPLDQVIPADRTISLIHLDVEGHEEEVLAGATEILEKYKPLIITEINNEKTLRALESIGYRFKVGLEEKKWEKTFRNAVFESATT